MVPGGPVESLEPVGPDGFAPALDTPPAVDPIEPPFPSLPSARREVGPQNPWAEVSDANAGRPAGRKVVRRPVRTAQQPRAVGSAITESGATRLNGRDPFELPPAAENQPEAVSQNLRLP